MAKREINEKSLRNLKKFSKDYQPTAEKKSKGKKKSWAKIKENEKSADILNRLLQKVITNKTDGSEMTQKEAMLYGLVIKAIKEQDIKSIELILKLIGDLDNKLSLDATGINITVTDNDHKQMLEDL